MLALDSYKNYLAFSLEQYQKFQLTHLQRFVAHTSVYSKHYKELKLPQHISSYEDFSQLPLLEQEDLRVKDIEEFRASPWEKICTVTRSSGTTGKSKIVLWTHEALEWEKKWGAFGFLMANITPGSRYAILMPLEMSRISSFISICESIGATAIPIGRVVTDTDEDNAIELIKRIGATHILATPARLNSLGQRIGDLGCDLKKDFQIKYLITGGMHSTDVQKKKLEELWQATIFEQAGANELSFTGFECNQHDGLHILPGSHYIEVIDPITKKLITDNITPGEILITSFSNIGTPLLRYRIGDLGVISYKECKCGLSFPRLFIRGRTMGTILLGGTKLYSYQIENTLGKFLPLVTLHYKVTIAKIEGKDVVVISIEVPKNSLKNKELPYKIRQAFFEDTTSMYEVLAKINSGKVEIKIHLAPVNTLQRSHGDKIKNQFEDLRQDF